MRKTILWMACFLLGSAVVAARPLKLHVNKPGTLASLVGEKKKYTTRKMVLAGMLNGDDLRFLREMAGSDINQRPTPGVLHTIDLTKVTFTPGGGAYVDKEGLHYVTGGKHTLPSFLFRNCPVEQVILPERLDSIQTGALEHTKLRRIELPDSVWVGPYAFYSDAALEEVVFPSHVKSIMPYAFGLSGVKHLSIHNIDNIAGHAFAELPQIETIEVKGYLGHIDGWYTFYGCPKLRSIDLYGPVLSTGGPTVLADCPVLERLTFHDVVYSTYFGEAKNCPIFKGYEAKGTVISSGNTASIPSLPQDRNTPKTEPFREAIHHLFPVLKQGIRGEEMVFNIRSFSYLAYDEACHLALEGKKTEALDWLELAVAAGWNRYKHMQEDRDLVSLRDDPRFKAAVAKAREKGDFPLILKQSAPYRSNDKEWPAFTYQSPTDSNLTRIREYFKLDSIAGPGDDISRMKKLMYWLHDAIRHDGSSMWPQCDYNAISLYEICQREGRGLNCRFLAMMLNELYLACGIPSRFLTCQPKGYKTDSDCHVINMAWSKSLNKWVWMDPSFAAFVSDENGVLLHPGEVRERLIKDRPLVLNEDANWNHETKQTVDGYLKDYMAKNLYWISAHLRSEYQTEGNNGANSRMIYLVPEGFLQFDGTTSDDVYFWQKPQPDTVLK